MLKMRCGLVQGSLSREDRERFANCRRRSCNSGCTSEILVRGVSVKMIRRLSE